MMRTVVTGGTGYVGRFIVERLMSQGDDVVVCARSAPPDGFFTRPVEFLPLRLGEAPPPGLFEGAQAIIHAAFDHEPGRYRGGEGRDPGGFRRRNLDGSIALFDAAKAAGVERVVFLSSRAVYGRHAPGAMLAETTEPRPDTLYGEVKLDAEAHLLGLADRGFAAAILRVTGVYGPAGLARSHKWAGLFADYLAGRPVAPRVASEVHGDDVARAVSLVLSAGAAPGINGGLDNIFNVSDVVVDHHDLLAIVQAATGSRRALPERADASALNVMVTDKLAALGWHPGGLALLDQTVRQLIGLAEP